MTPPLEDPGPVARLFVALWPDEATRQALHDHQALWQWGRQGVPTRRERLHMTLCFLGDWPRELKPALVQGLNVPFDPFTLVLDDASLWNRNEQGIARIGPLHRPRELQELHLHLSLALAQLGIVPRQQRFEPHITLARHAQQAVPPRQPPSIRWRVTGYVLVESDLRLPATYRVCKDYP